MRSQATLAPADMLQGGYTETVALPHLGIDSGQLIALAPTTATAVTASRSNAYAAFLCLHEAHAALNRILRADPKALSASEMKPWVGLDHLIGELRGLIRRLGTPRGPRPHLPDQRRCNQRASHSG